MQELTSSQIEEIQRATEDLLENVGVQVMHDGLVQRAREAGARVDRASGVVRLPAPLLRELLAEVPAQYQIADLFGNEFTVGSERAPGQGNGLGCLAIVTDPWIVEHRPDLSPDCRKHDVPVAGRLAFRRQGLGQGQAHACRADPPPSGYPVPSVHGHGNDGHLRLDGEHEGAFLERPQLPRRRTSSLRKQAQRKAFLLHAQASPAHGLPCLPAVVPVDEHGISGASTYSLGIWTASYQAGYDTIGIPLQMSSGDHTADWYCDNINNSVGINYFISTQQRWGWHSTRMPADAYDPILVMTEGYQISTSVATKFTFIGV